MREKTFAMLKGERQADLRLEHMAAAKISAENGQVALTKSHVKIAIRCVGRHNPNLKSFTCSEGAVLERLSMRKHQALINKKVA